MDKIFKAIGLMSGTSLDGIDIALIESNGKDYIKLLHKDYFEYSNENRNKIRNLLFNNPSLFEIKNVENEITILHAELVNNFLKKNDIKSHEIDLIGFHGQTIAHNPDSMITWQIGNIQLLNHLTKILVVGDFRVKDVIEGGQGAPLVPIYHYYRFNNHQKPLVILNIGGVANITYFDDHLNSIIASDICFGNAPSNDLMLKKYNLECDKDGDLASKGKANDDIINEIINHELFLSKMPKSFSRNDFDNILSRLNKLSDADILASYAKIFSIILKNVITSQLPKIPKEILICGGGAYNKNLIKNLKNMIIESKITTIDEYGYIIDSVEAEAFAFLGIRKILNLPSSFFGTTKTSNKTGSILGVIYN